MTASTSKLPKAPALAGAAIGLVVFLAAALLPTLLYGGYAGVMLAAALFGAPASGGAASVLIVAGMVLAVVLVGALFALAGAAAGAAVGTLVRGVAVEKGKAKAASR